MKGSSPRVWGQVRSDSKYSPKYGIIPTRMGTSRMLLLCPHRAQDHPHAYGDKQLYCRRCVCIVGSSPRVWGQEAFQFAVQHPSGIIPTRMGTRALSVKKTLYAKDHPHAYGDKNGRATQRKRKVWIIPTRMGTR